MRNTFVIGRIARRYRRVIRVSDGCRFDIVTNMISPTASSQEVVRARIHGKHIGFEAAPASPPDDIGAAASRWLSCHLGCECARETC